jgi:glycosyltransferase involved in cell wall biosynthesis
MLVSGLTIIRNGVKLNYPFEEAIRSALDICDEYVVVAGDSEDETMDRLLSIDDPRLRIVESHWSPWVRPGKYLLAQQTNVGLGMCRGRWCLYLQANEVIHESSLPRLRGLMEEHADNEEVEALLLERLTFWADYRTYVPIYPRRFKYSLRIVRNHIGIYSIRDAMSFAVFDDFSTRGRAPRSIDSGEDLYRYGYVHTNAQQSVKLKEAVHKFDANDRPRNDYHHSFYPRQFLARYDGSHPAVMAERIAAWPEQQLLDLDRCRTKMSIGEKKRLLENGLYCRFGFPKWRDTRYQLLGDFVLKQRPQTRWRSGTMWWPDKETG